MANNYFDHTTKLQPGTKARAEEVNQRFDNVVLGFDKLPAPHPTLKGFNEPIVVGAATEAGHAVSVSEALGGGISYAADTGVANAYVVNLDIAPAAYVDGLTITFKALNANTGASTININGLGIKQLTRSNGNALVAGDIAVGQITTVIYNGTKFLGMAAFQGQFDELADACEGYATSAGNSATSAGNSAGTATAQAVLANSARIAAELAETNAELAETNAEAAETLAEAWAANPFNTIVADGKYSAYHWATVAANEAAAFTPASQLADIKTVDGSGSGLDADLLDGQHGSYYAPLTSIAASALLTSIKTVDGAASGLDADLLDGQHGAYYAPLASPTFTGTVGGITKTMVGLGNVDNTSDANKPVSTLQQSALDLKAPLLSPALTGTPTAPTAAAATDTTQIATTAFVHDVADAISVGPLAVQVFTSSGTYTKTAGATVAIVEVLGGGGGGAGYQRGSGGSGGGYAKKRISLSGVTTEAVTVGAAGTGGAAGANGVAGGTSSFGAHCSATGGGGGVTAEGLSAASGSGSGGDINITGQLGYVTNFGGGDSMMGFGGNSSGGASGYGAGGLGTADTAGSAGGNGTAGIVIVTEY